jgi:hypothetical protein
MRKLFSLLLVELFLLAFTSAQTNIPQIQHVIVIVQENRTTVNLFGGDSALAAAGAHLPTSGSCHGTSITLSPFRLDACFDNSHKHEAWESAWDNTVMTGGAMDGDCDVPATLQSGLSPTCKTQVSGLTCPSGASQPYCTGYTYVTTAPDSKGYVLVQPYYDMAAKWGYANYMFQTNQGPSFPAHQFLFSGTSSPIWPGTPYYKWFAADNNGGNGNGCIAKAGSVVEEVNPNNGNIAPGYTPPYGSPDDTAGYPCYDHATLSDVLDTSSISWKYYANGSTSDAVPFDSLWTAPNAIWHICVPSLGTDNTCTGSDFTSATNAKVVNDLQIISDLGATPSASSSNCNLPAVSWVIPDGNWSDHPGTQGHDGGSSWVSAIVNAVGGYDNSGNRLAVQCGYWSNTVVLVTWDDWGGFYEDTNPITAMSVGNSGLGGYPGTTNGTYYVYGFRVPLLVISAYARPSYISGGNVYPPACIGTSYCHDFGSILNFIEYAFGSGGNHLGPISGSSDWPYADSFVQDLGETVAFRYSLHDFFNFSVASPFTPITSAQYPTSCFWNAANALGCFPGYPAEPDSD